MQQCHEVARHYLVKNFFLNLRMDNLSFHSKAVLMGEIEGSLKVVLKPSDSEKKLHANIKPIAMKSHTKL